jgi:uncharacterized protein DUF11
VKPPARLVLVVLGATVLAALLFAFARPERTEAQGTFTLTISKICGTPPPRVVSPVHADFAFTMSSAQGVVKTVGPLSCPEGGETSFTTAFSDEETWTLTEIDSDSIPVSTLRYRVTILCGTAEDADAFGTNDDPNNGIFDPDPPFIDLSGIPAGTDVRCLVINNLVAGSVVVTKLCDDPVLASTNTLFRFALDGPDTGGEADILFAPPCGAQHVLPLESGLEPGSYSLTETGTQIGLEVGVFDISNFDVSIACGSPSSTPVPVEGPTASFTIPDNENAIVVCEVTNSLPDFSVTVFKQCDPAEIEDEFFIQVFTEFGDGSGGAIGDSVPCGGVDMFTEIEPTGEEGAHHTLRELGDNEQLLTGYDVEMLCTGDVEPTEGPSREIIIDDLGTPVFCVITNSELPGPGDLTLTVEKNCTDSEAFEGPFELELETPEQDVLPIEFADCESDEEVLDELAPGTYTLTETETDGATSVVFTCVTDDDNALVGSVTGTSLTFQLTEDTSCLVSNAGEGFVPFTVAKECTGEITGFVFQVSAGGQPGEVFELDCGESISANLPVSEFTVTETDTAGAVLTTIDCGEGADEGTAVDVSLTAATTCTFTNSGPEAPADTADVGVTANCTPTQVPAGGTTACTLTVTNHGPTTALAVSMTTATPVGTTFASLTNPGGWTCTAPNSGGTGAIACDPDMAPNETAVFTLVLNVNQGTPPGTQLTLNVSVESEAEDPIPGNNTDSDTVVVIAAAPPVCCPPINIDLDIDNENTNVIGIDNETENQNTNDNANTNQNANDNTNEQSQDNTQGQDNTNDQTNNIDSRPKVNISR